MPKSSKLGILVGGGVLCAVTAASVTAATWPASSAATAARPASMAGLALAGGSALSGSALSGDAQFAAQGQARQAGQALAVDQAQGSLGVQQARAAVAQVRYQIDLDAVSATAHAAHQAHLALLARQAAAARAAAAAKAAAARAAAAQAAQQAAASQQASSTSSSSGSGSSSSATAVSAPSGTPQQIAQQMLNAQGQGGQFSCLYSLWERESGWNVYASNPGSGAYGIPQALPGSKMASAGADWQTSAATQIRWGLEYIDATYGSPCGAWAHEESAGWY